LFFLFRVSATGFKKIQIWWLASQV